MSGHDNSWFSDTTKTWMVSITMAILIFGMVGGYWAAYNWKQERMQAQQIQENENVEDNSSNTGM